jgi:hypothetical protein
LEVWESVRRHKGIIYMREATLGRGGLSVKDWIVKAFPVGKGVSEVMEEGGEKGGCSVFLFFSSAKVISLFC